MNKLDITDQISTQTDPVALEIDNETYRMMVEENKKLVKENEMLKDKMSSLITGSTHLQLFKSVQAARNKKLMDKMIEEQRNRFNIGSRYMYNKSVRAPQSKDINRIDKWIEDMLELHNLTILAKNDNNDNN